MDVLKVVVGVNEFVTRQTMASEFSFYEGSFEDAAALARIRFDLRKSGYRDGVVTFPPVMETGNWSASTPARSRVTSPSSLWSSWLITSAKMGGLRLT